MTRKHHKKAKKVVVYVVLGTENVAALEDGPVAPDLVREFDTQAEADAFMLGIGDATGWLESAFVDEEGNELE